MWNAKKTHHYNSTLAEKFPIFVNAETKTVSVWFECNKCEIAKRMPGNEISQ